MHFTLQAEIVCETLKHVTWMKIQVKRFSDSESSGNSLSQNLHLKYATNKTKLSVVSGCGKAFTKE